MQVCHHSTYDQGVSLAFLMRLAASTEETLGKAATTGDMVNAVVRPLTDSHGCCLLDLLVPEAKGCLDRQQGFFISHHWAASFSKTVELLANHFVVESPDDARASQVFLWMVSSATSVLFGFKFST
jgi:hypothetical protein